MQDARLAPGRKQGACPWPGASGTPARAHCHAMVSAPLLPLGWARATTVPGTVRNQGATGWEIPHAATGAHVCLLSMALLLPQEPPMEAALEAYQILKGKKGFQHMKPCS